MNSFFLKLKKGKIVYDEELPDIQEAFRNVSGAKSHDSINSAFAGVKAQLESLDEPKKKDAKSPGQRVLRNGHGSIRS